MQGKPTPGPWVPNSRHTGQTVWRVESDAEGYPNDGWIIADCLGPDAEANAHLLASAPYLLARLASYEAALREIMTIDNDRAILAIARKALGDTP